jgi:dephospho-CoA kinase
MKIIGLTGGIGSGKSTVLKMFQKLGAITYIADVEAKKLMNTNEELKNEIIKLFGPKAYENNELNRQFISSIVFKNKEKLVALNNLVHPKVKEHFKNFTQKSKAKFVIYEAAILFESGSAKMCNYIITVTSKLDDRISRIKKRDGTEEIQILERIKNQSNDEFKVKKSNFVIKNNNLNATKQQVTTIFNLLLKLCN